MTDFLELLPDSKQIKVSLSALKTLLKSIGNGVAKATINTFFSEVIIVFKSPTNNEISAIDWSNLDDILSKCASDNNGIFSYNIDQHTNSVQLDFNQDAGTITE